MATISKTLTTATKTASISGGVLHGSISFVDEKGNQAGQVSITVKDGKVTETGLAVSDALKNAIVTIGIEYAALVDTLVSAGSLDPMDRGPKLGK
jgi:hypothetical protein